MIDVEKLKRGALKAATFDCLADGQFNRPNTHDVSLGVIRTIDYLTARNLLGGVPDGYVLVPKEPTEKMLNADFQELDMDNYCAGIVWRAMLAAAPNAAEVG